MLNIFKCFHCGNKMLALHFSGVTPVCCGDPMTKLDPHTIGPGSDTHLPQVISNNDKLYVTVGRPEHPMTSEHLIQWIALETSQGIYVKRLSLITGTPKACFLLKIDEIPLAVYSYCNIHGLWMTEVS